MGVGEHSPIKRTAGEECALSALKVFPNIESACHRGEKDAFYPYYGSAELCSGHITFRLVTYSRLPFSYQPPYLFSGGNRFWT